MTDQRFARLRTDPRFRKPRRKLNKVVIDDRFKSIFNDKDKKFTGKSQSVTVDKYGRKLPSNHDSDNLKRFYRLEQEEELQDKPAAPDYARGEVLMESSDEEDQHLSESDSNQGEVVLGKDIREPIRIPADEPEVDLDESQFAELDALAVVNAAKSKDDDALSGNSPGGEETNRIAVVNLDWDHVRASHLFKIFSSVVSPPSVSHGREKAVLKGSGEKVLSVRIYPSEFGKARLDREQKEGPPKELFKKRDSDNDNDQELIGDDDGNEYDEEALRKYQLERLRYYYAIVVCDTVDAAVRVYTELDGTELERSANVFDLSFVPDDMTFNDEPSDEATNEGSGKYKGVDFVTDALRHSRVKLTWDNDDPERNKITRRTLSRKEIEESDFNAYLASSDGSDDENSDAEPRVNEKRDKMRALLLEGRSEDNELLPEGWGKTVDKTGEMEITFTPGLSGSRDNEGEEETTLQQYLRKQKEKRKNRKKARLEVQPTGAGDQDDEFFGVDSEGEEDEETPAAVKQAQKSRVKMGKSATPEHVESTAAELDTLMSVESSRVPKHFDMRAVIKAEKAGSKKRGTMGKRSKDMAGDDEAQEDFVINVRDDRFKALHEDHVFAIDPTNPHFKKTKSMSALLGERAKRQRENPRAEEKLGGRQESSETPRNLKNLVESVKRKSALVNETRKKRRKGE